VRLPRTLLCVALAALPGCVLYDDVATHMAEESHWWHAAPARAGFLIGYAPVYPVAALEAAVLGQDDVSMHGGPFQLLGTLSGGAVGLALGGPFYAVSRPMELIAGEGEETRPPRNNAQEEDVR